jgi:hypothetical protein
MKVLPDTRHAIADVAFAEYLIFLGVGDVQTDGVTYTLSRNAAASVSGALNLAKSAARITELKTGGMNATIADTKITDLSGIEFFINVDSIYLASNELATLDVSALTKLRYLSMNSNFLTSLDLSANTELRYLSFNASTKAGAGKLSSIDLTKNTKLEELNLKTHNITTLDLSKNTALRKVDVSANPGAPFVIPAAIYDNLTTATGVSRGS